MKRIFVITDNANNPVALALISPEWLTAIQLTPESPVKENSDDQ